MLNVNLVIIRRFLNLTTFLNNQDDIQYCLSLSVSVFSLCILDTQADKFYDRGHAYCEAFLPIQGYTQHTLLSNIDLEINHARYFIKIPYIKKGFDLIELPIIFKNNSVVSSILAYFLNTESAVVLLQV